jgi:tRNA-splicing ligase RtcB
MLEAAIGDQSIEQAINAATLPGVVEPVVVMPDMHQGYGFPIGGVAATRLPDGVIHPGAIGYDINCGVRLLASQIQLEEVEPNLAALADALNRRCPSGVGVEGAIRLREADLDQVCRLGARWALKKGLAAESDLDRTEEGGCLEGADRVQSVPRRGNGGWGSLAP